MLIPGTTYRGLPLQSVKSEQGMGQQKSWHIAKFPYFTLEESVILDAREFDFESSHRCLLAGVTRCYPGLVAILNFNVMPPYPTSSSQNQMVGGWPPANVEYTSFPLS